MDVVKHTRLIRWPLCFSHIRSGKYRSLSRASRFFFIVSSKSAPRQAAVRGRKPIPQFQRRSLMVAVSRSAGELAAAAHPKGLFVATEKSHRIILTSAGGARDSIFCIPKGFRG